MAKPNLTTAQEKEYHSSMVFARVSHLGPFPEKESLEMVLRLAETWSLYHLDVKDPARPWCKFGHRGIQTLIAQRVMLFGRMLASCRHCFFDKWPFIP